MSIKKIIVSSFFCVMQFFTYFYVLPYKDSLTMLYGYALILVMISFSTIAESLLIFKLRLINFEDISITNYISNTLIVNILMSLVFIRESYLFGNTTILVNLTLILITLIQTLLIFDHEKKDFIKNTFLRTSAICVSYTIISSILYYYVFNVLVDMINVNTKTSAINSIFLIFNIISIILPTLFEIIMRKIKTLRIDSTINLPIFTFLTHCPFTLSYYYITILLFIIR
jgi:hypothetical protein